MKAAGSEADSRGAGAIRPRCERPRRRVLLAAGGLIGATAGVGQAAKAGAAPAKVVVIGGGWGGLSAAAALRRHAPALEVRVLDREPVLRPLPLSNPWLVDRLPARLPPVDRTELARRHGFGFVAAGVTAIDRERRVVHTDGGRFDYDWLVLATGADYDDGDWFGGDARAAAEARARFPGGFVASELDALKRGLAAFRGGDLVMTVPPPPYRCPPAPYERAMLIGWWIRTQGLRARLTLVDPSGGMPRFNRLFAERYAAQIDHRRHSQVLSVDPFNRRLDTIEGELRFDHAILLPPMRAGALVEQAGLLGRDGQGRPTRWAAVDPLRLRSRVDERILLVGDVLDTVSGLFGHYPKTAHVACELGAAAALQIAAASRGEPPPVPLPRSLCHVWLDADPRELLLLEASYRVRGDGAIAQTVRQHDHPQPGDEDLQSALGMVRDRLGVAVP